MYQSTTHKLCLHSSHTECLPPGSKPRSKHFGFLVPNALTHFPHHET
ncbi:hypothetical protein BT93_A1005 [Corymbia citriodora subsp. variegata]|nr:hypothetical protein BT93_A1005 [Corymbia citriodora subsp. variegata]